MTLQVGVKVILVNPEGKVLLLLRSGKYRTAAGKWDIPGGRIEVGSSLLVNLAREVQEETGLAMTSTPELIGAQDFFADDARYIVRLTYKARTEGVPVLDGDEHTEYRWSSYSELLATENLDRYVKALLDTGKIVI